MNQLAKVGMRQRLRNMEKEVKHFLQVVGRYNQELNIARQALGELEKPSDHGCCNACATIAKDALARLDSIEREFRGERPS